MATFLIGYVHETAIFTELQQNLQAAVEMSKSLQMIVRWKKILKYSVYII